MKRRVAVFALRSAALRLTCACMAGVFLLVVGTAAAINLAGFAVPSAIKTRAGVLQAASCGVRNTLWIEHYVAVLYLRPAVTLHALQDPTEPKAVFMYVVDGRYLPGEIPAKWRGALDSALKQSTMRDVHVAFAALASGDLAKILYVPGEGVSVSLNGKLIARTPDHRAVDAIVEAWASDAPLLEKLERLATDHAC